MSAKTEDVRVDLHNAIAYFSHFRDSPNAKPAIKKYSAAILASHAAQAERIASLEAGMKELADDLEGEVETRYGGTKSYPTQKRRYERDIEVVTRARALLSGKAP